METAIPQTAPFMETAIPDLETDAAKMAHQPDDEVLPLIETVRPENQRLHIELGNCASEKELLKQELAELRSQLKTERANREETEAELFELKQNSAPVATLFEKLIPDTATILSQLARQT
jgi:hypothetical protein